MKVHAIRSIEESSRRSDGGAANGKETLDLFCDAMMAIAEEAKKDPDLLHKAPHKTKMRRLDEAKAARELKLRYKFL